MPFGSTSTTSAPKVVTRLELVVLWPCAVRPDDDVCPTRFCIALLGLNAPNRAVIFELAFEDREFFTCPSVEAARLSVTTTDTTSWSRKALTSVPKRTSCPLGLQIDP